MRRRVRQRFIYQAVVITLTYANIVASSKAQQPKTTFESIKGTWIGLDGPTSFEIDKYGRVAALAGTLSGQIQIGGFAGGADYAVQTANGACYYRVNFYENSSKATWNLTGSAPMKDRTLDCPAGKFAREDRAEDKNARYQEHLKLGYDAFEDGDYPLAIAEFERARHIDEDDGKADVGEGKVYLAQKIFDKAIQQFSDAIALEPENAEFLNERCLAYTFLSDHFEDAIRDADRAIALDGKSSRAYYCRGAVAELRNSWELAVSDLNKALILSPNDVLISKKLEEVRAKKVAADTQDEEQERAAAIAAEEAKKQEAKAEKAREEALAYKGPPELEGVDILYWSRDADEGGVASILDEMLVPYRTLNSKEAEPSNTVACTSDLSIETIKFFVKKLIDSGLKIRSVAPSEFEDSYKKHMTIESYASADKFDPLTDDEVDELASCNLEGEVTADRLQREADKKREEEERLQKAAAAQSEADRRESEENIYFEADICNKSAPSVSLAQMGRLRSNPSHFTIYGWTVLERGQCSAQTYVRSSGVYYYYTFGDKEVSGSSGPYCAPPSRFESTEPSAMACDNQDRKMFMHRSPVSGDLRIDIEDE